MLIMMVDGEIFDLPKNFKKISFIKPLGDEAIYGQNANAIVDIDEEQILIMAANDKTDEQIINQHWDELVDGVDWLLKDGK